MASITMDPKSLRTNKDGKVLITYDQIVKMPEFPESPVLEIFNGELFMPPSPNIKHQRISRKLGFLIIKFVEENDLGEVFQAPTDIKLSDENLVVPDIFFISQERRSIIKESYIEGPPDLVIEILSSNRNNDLIYKKGIYEEFGVTEYWIIDPEAETLMMCTLENKSFQVKMFSASESINSNMISNFSFYLSEIFE